MTASIGNTTYATPMKNSNKSGIPSHNDWIWERIDILKDAVEGFDTYTLQDQIKLLDELVCLLEDQMEQYDERLAELRQKE